MDPPDLEEEKDDRDSKMSMMEIVGKEVADEVAIDADADDDDDEI